MTEIDLPHGMRICSIVGMAEILSQIEVRLTELRAEIEELETAARVCRRLSSGHILPGNGLRQPKVAEARTNHSRKDLAGKTVKESAEAVLKDSMEPLHYREVFSRARDRGFSSGRKSGGAAVSFWAIMKRDPAHFEAAGDGKFRLPEKPEVQQ